MKRTITLFTSISRLPKIERLTYLYHGVAHLLGPTGHNLTDGFAADFGKGVPQVLGARILVHVSY